MCCAQGILACQYSSCKSYYNESMTDASALCRWARPMMMIQFACYVVWLSAFQIFLLLFQVIPFVLTSFQFAAIICIVCLLPHIL